MAYFIYENWTHDRVRVHVGECGMCNFGRGIQAADSGRNGRWLPAFDDRQTAFEVAKALQRIDTNGCAFCSP